MKFFTVSLFVLLSSAILGGSFATPSHDRHQSERLLGELLGGVGNLVDDIGGALGGLLANLPEIVRNVLDSLPSVTRTVINAVERIVRKTGEEIVCVVANVVGDAVIFVAELADGTLVTVNLNLLTLEVCNDGSVVGRLHRDGSIFNNGQLIGYCNPDKGILVLAGNVVSDLTSILDSVVGVVDEILSGLTQLLGEGVSDILNAVKEAVANISSELSAVLANLVCATDDVLNRLAQVLQEVDETLVCVAEDLANNIITFTDVVDGLDISLDLSTFELTVDGQVVATYNPEDGSIVGPDGELCGCLLSDGVMVILSDIAHIVGQVVDTVV